MSSELPLQESRGQVFEQASVERPSVAAVVVTFNRCDLLRQCLCALKAQTRPVQEIIVVDNASQDGTGDMLWREFPEVVHHRMKENAGSGGGAAAGLELAYNRGHDWFWMFDDDAFPHERALERTMALAHLLHDKPVGMVWVPDSSSGGRLWRSKFIHLPPPQETAEPPAPYVVDFVDLDHTLVSRSLVKDIGCPRSDFFMMMWALEYCLRAKKAGYQTWVVPQILSTHLNAGSPRNASPPWRGYYQTRNQLVVALGNRSGRELFWWGVRQAKFAAGIVLHLDSKRERLRLRVLGAWHGLLGRMGRTIDPIVSSSKSRIN